MKPDLTKLGFVRSGALIAVLCIMTMHSTFAEIPLAERRSGYDLLCRETRAMQDDDDANPGMLWVLDGEALWRAKAGTAEKACADCHGDARETMKGIAARYPAFDPARGRPVDLEQRINICRSEQQKAQLFAYESKDLLALTAYVARQSRGMPIEGAADERLKSFVDTGRALFTRRQRCVHKQGVCTEH
jgi:L-cysteine S-thiosulfotransferase